MRSFFKNKTARRLSILGGVLVLLLGAFFLIRALTPEPPPEVDPPLRYEPVAGEATNGNYLYPAVTYEGKNKTALTLDIRLESEDGTFGIYKAENNATFYFYTIDDEGEQQIYYPPIAEADSNFDYGSLYATDDMGLGLGIPRITYLAVSAGNIAFTERIPLSEDEGERRAQLQKYGLDDATHVLSLQYKDKSEQQQRHTVTVGDIIPGNNGYYCMVDDRPYVYASSTDSLRYILQPFAYYVNPALIAPGTQGQQGSQFEGYVTVSFREFVNKVYKDAQTPIPSDAKVYVEGQKRPGGETTLGPTITMEFALSHLAKDDTFARLVSMITASRVGQTELLFTQQLPMDGSRLLTFSKDVTSHAYTYTITRVDALLREHTELTQGTVGNDTVLKISYLLQKDGAAELVPAQGILDLSAVTLDTAVRDKLAALPVGEELSSSQQVSFTLTYTESQADQRRLYMYMDDILAVYDADGNPIKTIEEDSLLYCRYHYTIEGETTAPIVDVIDLGALSGAYGDSLRDALVGKTAQEDMNLIVYVYTEQYEQIYAYTEYSITSILSFVVEEEIVAFGFENEADRDPFYRETYFSNRLPKDHPHRLYGLNDAVCQRVIRDLGGMQDNASSAAGLFGTETVEIGLTAAHMVKYGLYANTVYLEVPRGITTVVTESGATEFRWLYTLPFTLFISDVQYDPDTGEAFRYVASDLYDVVVRIEAETFDFLNHSFTDYWARESMILVDIAAIESLKLEFFFDDLRGSYDFRVQTLNVPQSDGTTYTWYRINVEVGEGCTHELLLSYMQTDLTKLLADKSQAGVTPPLLNLNYIYNMAWGVEDATLGKSYAGDGYFQQWLEMLYYVSYAGTLSAEEQQSFLKTDLLMRMTLDLEGKANNYVFEFYRGSDRRVMVRLYQVNYEGVMVGDAVQDFYISSYGFKKIASGVQALLGGERFDGADYIDPKSEP